MDFTEAQRDAIGSSGNTIVVAGAGAGKTRTLVERCASMLLAEDWPVSIEEMLVVTFTDAAAAEVRHRLRLRLEKEYASAPRPKLLEQIARLDSAFVSTLHSFCFRLIRQHFAELGIDPGVALLNEQQGRILFSETMGGLFREHYEGKHENSGEVQILILEYFDSRDQELKDLIGKIHAHTQTRPNPREWFSSQLDLLGQEQCGTWRQWYLEAILDWANWWIPHLRELPAENLNAHECARILERVSAGKDANTAALIAARDDRDCWPKKKKTAHRKPFENLFKEASLLACFAAPASGSSIDPLEQDWAWSREPMRRILTLARQFEAHFKTAKLDRSVLDFHDLEQMALELLWDSETGRPTAIARDWQQRFKFIFVDEYQDINQAQDLIVSALSRPSGNRFLVGDIKQSIYRFRQGDPAIFQGYIRQAGQHDPAWKACFLSANFRSQEQILQLINPFFKWLMRPELGGIEYTDDAALIFGNPEGRGHLASGGHSAPLVEINLLLKTKSGVAEDEDQPSEEEADNQPVPADLETAEKEARLIGQRLKELVASGYRIWDETDGVPIERKLEYKDIVILLRAPGNKADAYAKAFDALGIPLEVKRDSFYATPEILDLLNLLTLLDNPIQDVPLIGVLRSPLVGLGVDDLAKIRLAARETSFWAALNLFASNAATGAAQRKTIRFLEQFSRWRDPGNCASLAGQLETILAETHYAEWVLTQPRGRQRHANLQQLVRIAREFDSTRGEGLYQFLRHVNELQDEVGDIEPAPLESANAVRLMSIHKSKGLEFPVVVVGDLGKAFNLQDGKAATLLDERYGLCSRIKAPSTGRTYKSLPLHLAQTRTKRESVGEEMRLLYVAFTRARNLLILSGTIAEKQVEEWPGRAATAPSAEQLLRAKSPLEWLAQYLSAEKPEWLTREHDAGRYWRSHVTPNIPDAEATRGSVIAPAEITPENLAQLRERLSFTYPFQPALTQPAKSSVSAVRKALEQEEEASTPFLDHPIGDPTAIKRGLASHLFLELLDLEAALDLAGLEQQRDRFVSAARLDQEDAGLVNLQAVAHFWQSEVGCLFLAERESIHREFPFTFRIGASEARAVADKLFPQLPTGEFVIIQGIADLILIRSDEAWLLDFKTDAISEGRIEQLVQKYRPQINLYALGLNAILNRRVTRRWLHFLAVDRTVEL